jgi:hypothetical protein
MGEDESPLHERTSLTRLCCRHQDDAHAPRKLRRAPPVGPLIRLSVVQEISSLSGRWYTSLPPTHVSRTVALRSDSTSISSNGWSSTIQSA